VKDGSTAEGICRFNDMDILLPDGVGRDGLRNVEILRFSAQEDFIIFKNLVPTSQTIHLMLDLRYSHR
jgi:hypothetical protein